MNKRQLTQEQFTGEGVALFGEDMMVWRFVCPCCGHVASVADYKEAGAPEGAVGFSCIGRWAGAKRGAFGEGQGPCDYAGGGLINVSPVLIDGRGYFDFSRGVKP